GRTINWSSANSAIATVSSSGLVKGIKAGSTSIYATVEGKRGTTAMTITAAPEPEPEPTPEPEPDPTPEPTPDPTPDPTPTERVGYFVSPSGSSSGSGTKASPWDLGSVLRGSKSVAGGDTVWVRGGTYRGEFYSTVSGTSSRQLVIRQYPGERATIDGNLAVVGPYVTFWGLEIMNSNPV